MARNSRGAMAVWRAALAHVTVEVTVRTPDGVKHPFRGRFSSVRVDDGGPTDLSFGDDTLSFGLSIEDADRVRAEERERCAAYLHRASDRDPGHKYAIAFRCAAERLRRCGPLPESDYQHALPPDGMEGPNDDLLRDIWAGEPDTVAAMCTPIDVKSFSTRAQNCLAWRGAEFFGDLAVLSPGGRELMRMKGVGRHTHMEIRGRLQKLGLDFGTAYPHWDALRRVRVAMLRSAK